MRIFSIFVLTIMLASCGGRNSNSKEGTSNADTLQVETTTESGLTIEVLSKSPSYDFKGEAIAVEGKFSLDRMVVIVNNGYIPMEFKPNGHSEIRTNIRLNVDPEASAMNMVYVPEKFTKADIVIFDDSGAKHGCEEKFRVTGTIVFTHKDWEKSVVYTEDPKMPEAVNKLRRQTAERKAKEADEREQRTGDRNDYSFEIKVSKIEVVK